MARPRGTTKERILDVALELFTEQGYDKTSLREIAERLAITKAALYYHFRSKAEILLELHLRMHALGEGLLDELDAARSTKDVVASWPHYVDAFIDQVLENRALFLLHERNQNAFAEIVDDPRHRAANEDFEGRFRRLLQDTSIPLEQRVRMMASLGAVLITLMGAGSVFDDRAAGEVADHLRGVVHDLFPG